MMGHARRRVALAAGSLVLGASVVASAQATMPGVDDFAQAMVTLTSPHWEGPRVEPPPPTPRPSGAVPLAISDRFPVAVHGPPDVPPGRAAVALASLEAAFEDLETAGWPTPPSDGGRGGTPGFDLYLVSTAANDVRPYADASVPWSFLDAVSAFAVVPLALPDAALDVCITDAYAQALLLTLDPAEAPQWRRASAAFLTQQLTGSAGCVDARREQRQEPWRSWVSDGAGDGAGGVVLLDLLDARNTAHRGDFVRDAWELARQRTWEGSAEGLRASPDLWMALQTLVTRSGDDWETVIRDAALGRYLGAASPPPHWATRWGALPRRSRPFAPPLEPYGSAYVEVDTTAAPPDAHLSIWLRGEYGVAWGLTAVRLDAEGHEEGRLDAPSRRDVPRSFLPVELTGRTARVLIVATNLSSRLPDADAPDTNTRSLVVALAPGTE